MLMLADKKRRGIEFTKEEKTRWKIGNLGVPGGMGHTTMHNNLVRTWNFKVEPYGIKYDEYELKRNETNE